MHLKTIFSGILIGSLSLSAMTAETQQKTKVFNTGDEWKVTDLSEVRIKEGSALDFSGFFPKGEAGTLGRASVAKDGSLQFEKDPGKKIRLHGFVAGWWSIQPLLEIDSTPVTRNQKFAEYAQQMKRHGYNFFRFHGLLDSFFSGMKRSGTPSAEQLDTIDLLAAELKKNGIYLYVDLCAYGMRFGKDIPYNTDLKAGTMIKNPLYWNAWKKCAEDILNHVNPHTGLAWKDDPAIICVTHFNEQATGAKIATQQGWAKTPDNLKQKYLKEWRKWMTDKYGSPEKAAKLNSPMLKGKKDFSTLEIPQLYGKDPLGQEYHCFLTHLFTERNKDYNKVVRDAGYEGSVSQYNSNVDLGASAARWQTTDIVSNNSHWGHPSNSIHKGSRVSNRSSIEGSANGSAFNYGNRTNFIDRPMILSEFSHAFWNRERYENGILTPAYAALNGYAGILWHDSGTDLKAKGKWPRGLITNFRVSTSPIARASSVLSFFLFQRGDVKEASHSVEAIYSNKYLEQYSREATSTVQNRIGLITKFGVNFPELPRYDRLKSSVKSDIQISPDSGAEVLDGLWFSTTKDSQNAKFDLDAFVAYMKQKKLLTANNISKPSKGIYQSETGEITAYGNERTMQVITPKTEAVAGPAGKTRKLGKLTVNPSIDSCVSVSSLDGKPIDESGKMLLLYITSEANSGMEISEDGKTMFKSGAYPALLQTGKLNAEISNRNAGMKLYALGYDGSRKEEIPIQISNGKISIQLDTSKLKHGPTPFFELTK